MAINVSYQIPAGLLQQQRQKEERAYNRQVSLMKMQQQFQREQTEAQRDYSREQADANRAYQMELADRAQRARENVNAQTIAQKSAENEANRQLQARLADQRLHENLVRQVEAGETAAWQDGIRRRQQLEQMFDYTDAQRQELKQLDDDMRTAYEQYSQGELTPEQYIGVRNQLRARQLSIMPDTPKPPEETMDMAERIAQMTTIDPETGYRMGINSKGEVYYAMPPSDSTTTKLKTNAITEAMKAAMGKDGEGNQSFNEEMFKRIYKLLMEIDKPPADPYGDVMKQHPAAMKAGRPNNGKGKGAKKTDAPSGAPAADAPAIDPDFSNKVDSLLN